MNKLFSRLKGNLFEPTSSSVQGQHANDCTRDPDTYFRHNVTMTMGDRPNAGINANAYMVMHDDKGNKSPILKFDRIQERGSKETYKGPAVDDQFSKLIGIEVWQDTCEAFDGWYCDLIEVEDTKSDAKHAFPLQRLVEADIHYFIQLQPTCLPKDDKHPKERAEELAHERDVYQYKQKLPGFPLEIKELPPGENFSFHYEFDMAAVVVGAFGKDKFIEFEFWIEDKLSPFKVDKRWMSTDGIKRLYKYYLSPRPRSVAYYKDDVWFAARKLAGTNPAEIELCRKIPDKFEVTDDMLKEFLEGNTLSQAIEEKRLFIIDYYFLDGLPTKSPELELPAPMALFYLDCYETLRPIAIQLKQKPGPENPIFLPSDPANLWMLAKMWFNLADATVHQSLSHLGFTHLLMEGICISVHRNLAVNHPVFRLLHPHFLFLLPINVLAISKLLAPDGFVENTMQCGVKGMEELIAKRFKTWRFDIDGCLPEQIRQRGVDSQEVLPVYPYRDDGLPIYEAIRSYVLLILNHYYDTPQMMADDKEIQAWGREMAAPAPDGLQLQGMPNNGKFTNVEELCMVVTGIVFTCSVQHAAVNFGQYEEYAFPPNYPATLTGKIPRNKKDVPTAQDLVKIVADKKTTVETMTVTTILSHRATQSLGEGLANQYDEIAQEAEMQFQEQLKEISKQIEERNIARSELLKYDLLVPRNIPNAISI